MHNDFKGMQAEYLELLNHLKSYFVNVKMAGNLYFIIVFVPFRILLNKMILEIKYISLIQYIEIQICISKNAFKTFGSMVIVLECRRSYLTHQKRQR